MSKDKLTGNELEREQQAQHSEEQQAQAQQGCEDILLGADDQSVLPETIELKRDEILQVREHITALEKERDEMKGLAQRIQAEFDNFRRRNANIAADCREEGLRCVIRDLLPVLDNFDRALDSVEGVDAAWVEGIRMVHRQLIDTLGKCGLKEIPADGQFDPNLHDAAMQEACEGKESGCVLEVLQKGYQVNERIIRHSMVKVAQ